MRRHDANEMRRDRQRKDVHRDHSQGSGFAASQKRKARCFRCESKIERRRLILGVCPRCDWELREEGARWRSQ